MEDTVLKFTAVFYVKLNMKYCVFFLGKFRVTKIAKFRVTFDNNAIFEAVMPNAYTYTEKE